MRIDTMDTLTLCFGSSQLRRSLPKYRNIWSPSEYKGGKESQLLPGYSSDTCPKKQKRSKLIYLLILTRQIIHTFDDQSRRDLYTPPDTLFTLIVRNMQKRCASKLPPLIQKRERSIRDELAKVESCIIRSFNLDITLQLLISEAPPVQHSQWKTDIQAWSS